jgi:hypothetical protein
MGYSSKQGPRALVSELVERWPPFENVFVSKPTQRTRNGVDSSRTAISDSDPIVGKETRWPETGFEEMRM